MSETSKCVNSINMSTSNQASICNQKPILHIITSKLNGWNFIEWLPSWFEMLEFFGEISPIFRLLEQTDTIFHTDNRLIDFSQIFFWNFIKISAFISIFAIFRDISQIFRWSTQSTLQLRHCYCPIKLLPACRPLSNFACLVYVDAWIQTQTKRLGFKPSYH